MMSGMSEMLDFSGMSGIQIALTIVLFMVLSLCFIGIIVITLITVICFADSFLGISDLLNRGKSRDNVDNLSDRDECDEDK